jgi:hypothetical protein
MIGKDIEILNKFEGSEYRFVEMEVEIEGGERIGAFGYVASDPSVLDEREWDWKGF